MTAQPTRLAARVAALASLDLGPLAGKQAITARDVAALLPAPAFAAPRLGAMPTTRAERLALAKRQTPHFYQTIDVRLDEALGFAREVSGENATLPLVEIAIMATARLLRRTPSLNAAWLDEGLLLYDRVDIVLDRGGRTVLIAAADRKGLRAISQAIAAGDDGAGTFAVIDFTATGLREAAAIIDPQHAGVIALGAPQERVVAREGGWAVETYLRLTLSADHRVIDGAAAAEFLAALKTALEDPLLLLL